MLRTAFFAYLSSERQVAYLDFVMRARCGVLDDGNMHTFYLLSLFKFDLSMSYTVKYSLCYTGDSFVLLSYFDEEIVYSSVANDLSAGLEMRYTKFYTSLDTPDRVFCFFGSPEGDDIQRWSVSYTGRGSEFIALRSSEPLPACLSCGDHATECLIRLNGNCCLCVESDIQSFFHLISLNYCISCMLKIESRYNFDVP